MLVIRVTQQLRYKTIKGGGLIKFPIGERRAGGACRVKKIPTVENPLKMAPRKPSNLIVRHDTAEEAAARTAREAAVRPGRALPKAAPAALRGHEVASVAWRELMRLYGEIEGEIVSRLDLHLLVDYCMLFEQLSEIDRMRKVTYKLWLELGARHDKLVREAYDLAKADDEAMKAEAEAKEEQAIEVASKILDAFEAVTKLDGRADRKRDLLFKLRQSLYLTPRARAGVAPTNKPPEEAPDPLEALLDNVTDFVNGKSK